MRLGLPQRVDKLWKRLRQITTLPLSVGWLHAYYNIGEIPTSTSMYHKKEDLKKRNKLLRAFSLLGQDAQPELRNSNKVSIHSILSLVR